MYLVISLLDGVLQETRLFVSEEEADRFATQEWQDLSRGWQAEPPALPDPEDGYHDDDRDVWILDLRRVDDCDTCSQILQQSHEQHAPQDKVPV